MATVRITKLRCRKCGHRWYPRSTKPPELCPKCKSRKWNVKAENVSKKVKT